MSNHHFLTILIIINKDCKKKDSIKKELSKNYSKHLVILLNKKNMKISKRGFLIINCKEINSKSNHTFTSRLYKRILIINRKE